MTHRNVHPTLRKTRRLFLPLLILLLLLAGCGGTGDISPSFRVITPANAPTETPTDPIPLTPGIETPEAESPAATTEMTVTAEITSTSDTASATDAIDTPEATNTPEATDPPRSNGYARSRGACPRNRSKRQQRVSPYHRCLYLHQPLLLGNLHPQP